MKKFLIGLLIVGGVAAAIAVIMKRRSGSDLDRWEPLAEDTFSGATDAAAKATDAAKDAVA